MVNMNSQLQTIAAAQANECDDYRMAFTKLLVHSFLERVLKGRFRLGAKANIF
jgi:hypothetical protein